MLRRESGEKTNQNKAFYLRGGGKREANILALASLSEYTRSFVFLFKFVVAAWLDQSLKINLFRFSVLNVEKIRNLLLERERAPEG